MARSHAPMPYLIGLRLTHADLEKLQRLCAHTHREQADLLRLLIRLAEPVDGAAFPIRFAWTQDCDVPS